jgi:hypothetical protein
LMYLLLELVNLGQRLYLSPLWRVSVLSDKAALLSMHRLCLVAAWPERFADVAYRAVPQISDVRSLWALWPLARAVFHCLGQLLV